VVIKRKRRKKLTGTRSLVERISAPKLSSRPSSGIAPEAPSGIEDISVEFGNIKEKT
jgi:hypothetical protein